MYSRFWYKRMLLGVSEKLIATGGSRGTGSDTAVVSVLPFLIWVDYKCPEDLFIFSFPALYFEKHSFLSNCRQGDPLAFSRSCRKPRQKCLGTHRNCHQR